MSRWRSFSGAAINISFYLLHSSAQYDGCTNGVVADIGDGRCNVENNNPFCGFDGGDCCPCTCLDGPLHSCSDNDFNCLYPDCSQGFASEACFEEFAGDSYCNEANNNLACGYDGGDCCQCSCIDSVESACGVGGFACMDPICFDPTSVAEFPNCAGDWMTIGDGSCDDVNNNAACGFDGGDCCLCSCTGSACRATRFDCVDPDANTEFFDCEAPPPASSPCSADAQQTWVVETSAEARALAEAVNCSGGSFQVEWRGAVVVDAAITVMDGTVLNISGADSTAVIDGNETTRLFRVLNAVLYVSGIGIRSGVGFSGGAIAVSGSRLTLDRTNFTGNSAARNGGAVYASHGSTVICVGEGIFASNMATLDGGALCATGGSTVSCGGSWLSNAAGDSGGAIVVQNGSSVSWSDKTIFSNNTAGVYGGAVSLVGGSISWSGGATTFVGNSAVFFGGALVGFRSEIVFDGATDFLRNTAADGSGAIGAFGGSSVSWGGGTTRFISNVAFGFGGALLVMESRVEWDGNTEFNENVAEDGGAVYLMNGSYVAASGHTTFTSNTASADGGAVGSGLLDTLYSPTSSTLIVNGSTTFFNNTCGANGGAVALSGALSLAINVPNVNLVQNSAGVAGGGIFLSNTGFGPVFTDMSFVSNSAQVGGALSVSGSGNSLDPVNAQHAATTFERCRFIGNRAAATGGAIETAAGYDSLISSVFQGNAAGVGGALRLAGTASIQNCSFAENVSGDGEGAAVSNIGFISMLANTSFYRNVFDCPDGMFLNFSESSDVFQAVCDGCTIDCDGCSFTDPTLAPICSEMIDHASSPGVTVTLETLSIEPGYWRATASSPNVLPCFHAEACLGGVTGRADYCLEGYEGPYCAVCSDGYTARLRMTCSKCFDSTGGIVLAAGFSAAALLVVASVVSYVVSGDGSDRTRGVVERVGQYIPLQSLKILIVAWQIMTQFTSVANVSFPPVYQNLLDILELVNLDLGWILSGFCVVDVDFHDRLLIATIWPIVGLLFLAGVYTGAARVNRRSTRALQNVRHKHVSIVLLLTFLVYASVSALLFKTFACEELDDGKNYLRADYRIECDSPKHRAFQVYGGFMIVLYTVGIPALYGGLLFRDSDVLRQEHADREALGRISSISELWRPYKPSVFYYEVIECARRILLTGVVVFIYPNTGAQVAVALLMAAVFAMLSEGLAPYASRWDTWLSRMGHAVVTMSMYVALLLKVDVSNERSSSQNIFDSLLVAAHACMVVVILAEILVQGIALWVETREGSGTPAPNSCLSRCTKVFGRKRGGVGPQIAEAADNPFADHVYRVQRGRRRHYFAQSRRISPSSSSPSSSSSRPSKQIAPAENVF